jgi:peroxiredoxin
MTKQSVQAPAWMAVVLTLAGGYNLTWGVLSLIAPYWLYRMGGMADDPGQPLHNVELWQGLGMMLGIWGVGYLIAAGDPLRHWAVVLLGFLGKLFGVFGVVLGILSNRLGVTALWANVFNDLIWLVPFGLILLRAYRVALDEANAMPPGGFDRVIEEVKTAAGVSLAALSRQAPVLVVFLRHLGCTFCREALAELAARRPAIEGHATKLAFVHMGSPEQGTALLARYGLGDVTHFSDPDCKLYRAFGLERVPFWRFLRWQSLRRFWQAVRAGHRAGLIVGDGFRMPGVFLLHDGQVLRSFRHQDPGDRPEYEALAACSVPALVETGAQPL